MALQVTRSPREKDTELFMHQRRIKSFSCIKPFCIKDIEHSCIEEEAFLALEEGALPA